MQLDEDEVSVRWVLARMKSIGLDIEVELAREVVSDDFERTHQMRSFWNYDLSGVDDSQRYIEGR